MLGFHISYFRSIDANLAGLNAVLDEKGSDLLLFHGNTIVKQGKFVAYFLGHDGPRHFVGRNFPFGQSLHTHLAVFVGVVVDTTFDEKAQSHDAYGDDGC